jgi:uncharacterized protein
MSDAKSPKEPSMEEIIASISRIIAEDGGMREPVFPAAEKDDVLELTEALDEDGQVRRLDPAAPSSASPRTEPEPPPEADNASGKAEPSRDRILSAATSQTAATAFTRLGALPSARQTRSELPAGIAGRTLEDIVHDALRPLLRSWLDDHLPAIVERLVREEIARVTRDAGLR